MQQTVLHRFNSVSRAHAAFGFSFGRGLTKGLLSLGVAVALGGCATYQKKVDHARVALRSGDSATALKELEPLALKEGDDQLVYLLDYATALQMAGQFKESAKVFGRAEKIADIQDYHSISKVTTSLLLSEEMMQYKGDDYEKVLINGLNAINYLEMGELDDALVEVRRLNQKLYKYKYEAKRDYEQNPYAFYLAALIYEAGGKWDDAYISYKSAYEVAPNYPPLHEDLVRAAIRAQRPEDVEKWKAKFPEVKIRPEWRDKSMGEVVLILMQGWGPRKYPRPENYRFPYLVPVASGVQGARLDVKGEGDEKFEAQTSPIFSVQDVAIKTLNDDYARLIASRVAGRVTKAVVSDQIRQKNKLLGDLTEIALNASDRADLRQWSTLPQTIQFARIPVKAGKYTVSATGLFGYKAPTEEQMPPQQVEVKPNGKAFVAWRTVK
jgi:uncharacterized protein